MPCSSLLASQGLVAPPGLHRFQLLEKGWGCVRWLAKKKKTTAIQEVALHCASPPFEGWGGGGARFSFFQFGPKQEIVTLMHEQWRRISFAKTGHAGRNKLPSLSVVMVSSEYQFTYFGH